MNILKKGKIAKKGLWLLLLALFAGNVDAAQLRPAIDTYNSINGVTKIKSMTALLSLLSNKIDCEKIVNAAAGHQVNRNSTKLKELISNLVYTINNDAVNRKNAVDILHKIIFSAANDVARNNIFNHSAQHFNGSTINTIADFKRLNKPRHTVLTNYNCLNVFARTINSLKTNINNTSLSFTQGGQLKITVPVQDIYTYQPEIVDFKRIDDNHYIDKYNDRGAINNFSIQCYMNIGRNGYIAFGSIFNLVNYTN